MALDRLTDRVAVITGGASGIGLASARRMASEGATIVVVDMNAEAGGAVAEELGGLFVAADVTSPEDNERIYATTVETYGRVDIAFHNAGISPPEDDSILVTGLDAWRRVQEVNLTSVFLGCKAVIPHMQRQGKGSIINTASFVATMAAATSQISYTASKGGVLAMSRELGVQFAREGIRVNALSPGPVNTPLLKELFASDPERAARRLVHIPFGRFGEPEEIAAAVAFLASDDSQLHHRVELPGRRRHLRGVRHAPLAHPRCNRSEGLVGGAELDRSASQLEGLQLGAAPSAGLTVVDVQPVLRLEARE